MDGAGGSPAPIGRSRAGDMSIAKARFFFFFFFFALRLQFRLPPLGGSRRPEDGAVPAEEEADEIPANWHELIPPGRLRKPPAASLRLAREIRLGRRARQKVLPEVCLEWGLDRGPPRFPDCLCGVKSGFWA